MEPLSRNEIKEVFTESVAVLVAEFQASHDAHEKELDRLTKQSAEHYANFKAIEEKLTKQVSQCQLVNKDSQEKSGMRTGDIEQIIARHDQRMTEIENDVAEIKTGKSKNVELWVIALVALFAPAITKLIFGG